MRLNLPSTWTQQKMSALFLLTWLSVSKVEAEQASINCLNDNSRIRGGSPGNSSDYYSPYDALLSYTSSNNNTIDSGSIPHLCCTETNCSVAKPCLYNVWGATCNKISETVFCSTGNCGTIIGDNQITKNTTFGNCTGKDLDGSANYLANIPSQHFFGIDKGYAFWLCVTSSPCEDLWCYWDNGGWTCSYSTGTNFISKNCSLQWTASWPSSDYPSPSAITNGSLTYNSNLIPIIVPVGTSVGVGLIGSLTYYLIRRRKNKTLQKKVEEISLTNFESRNEALAHKPNQEAILQRLNEIIYQKTGYRGSFHNPNEYFAQVEIADHNHI